MHSSVFSHDSQFNCVNVTRSYHESFRLYKLGTTPSPPRRVLLCVRIQSLIRGEGGLNFFSVQDGKKAVIQAFTLQIQTHHFHKEKDGDGRRIISGNIYLMFQPQNNIV